MSAQNRPPPLVRKMSALAQPSLFVRTHHKFRKIWRFWASAALARTTPPCTKNIPSSWLRTLFYGTAHYVGVSGTSLW